MGEKIEHRDLENAQNVAKLLEIRGDDEFLDSARKILGGDEEYSPAGLVLTAVFTGLDHLGLTNRQDQTQLVKKGLEELGIDIP